MARRPSEVSQKRVDELNAGAAASNLAESLAVDFATLLEAAAPDLPGTAFDAMRREAATPYTTRMAAAARIILDFASPAQRQRLAKHTSDTVMGWMCYVVGVTSTNVDEAIERIRPFATADHYGVREWAWLGVRGQVVAEPLRAIKLLTPWTADIDPNARRFATEATRPRGVWCAHIKELKLDPAPGLAVLAPMMSDTSKYVQDSVSNWLNDAAKSSPDWVRDLCSHWSHENTSPATARIVRRALRSL